MYNHVQSSFLYSCTIMYNHHVQSIIYVYWIDDCTCPMIVLCTNKITIIYLMIVHKIPCVCVNFCSTYCRLFALGEGPIIYPMIVHSCSFVSRSQPHCDCWLVPAHKSRKIAHYYRDDPRKSPGFGSKRLLTLRWLTDLDSSLVTWARRSFHS